MSKSLKDLRIVFMGTPEFAVSSLEALVKAKCNIVGVITAPDKPAGRGMKMNESAVKKFAARKKLNILQPEKLKNPDFLNELKALQADLQVVVAFRMLPDLVWNMPSMGTINLHASLLPQYRGAAPINWAIINGELETGITTFKLKHDIDTGDILLQEKLEIGEAETAGELHDRMKELGAGLLLRTVEGLSEGTLVEKSQDTINMESGEGGPVETQALKHAPKIYSAICRIDWNQQTTQIYNLVRGLSPFPGAYTELGDKTLKIFSSSIELAVPTSRRGRWESDKKSFLKFACSDGYIHVKDIQLEGKKRMPIEEFLRGFRF